MVKKTVATYFSDLSGKEIESGRPTMKFSVDGSTYEVDVTDAERDEFKEAIAPYIAAGRKSAGSGRRATTSLPGDAPAPKAVRAWAREEGIELPSRGRIPTPVLDAYRAAH